MAVYTQLSNKIIANLVQEYGLGKFIRATPIAEGIENTNYLIETSQTDLIIKKSILTIYEKRMNINDLPFFLGVMEYLANNGLSCPLPRNTKLGEQTITLANGKVAAMVTFLNGKSTDHINNEQIASFGESMGQLHIVSQGFQKQRENDLSLKGWKNLLLDIGEDANMVCAGLCDELLIEMKWLESNWKTDLPSGIIHADLFPDNVFFIDNKVSGIIDFYFACNDYYIYDIAIAINAWCFDDKWQFVAEKAQILLDSYNVIRSITKAEREVLQVMCRGAAMRFLLTRIYDKIHTPKDALVTTKDPQEYLEKLRFHQKIKHHNEYGI